LDGPSKEHFTLSHLAQSVVRSRHVLPQATAVECELLHRHSVELGRHSVTRARLGHMVERHLEQSFEQFVADLFQAKGFKVERQVQVPISGLSVPDLLIRSSTGTRAIIEAKLYRSRTVTTALVVQAAAQAEQYRQSFEVDKAILVIGNKVSDQAKAILEKQLPNTLLYDVDVLAFLVADSPALLRRFEELTRVAMIFSEPLDPEPRSVNLAEDINRVSSGIQPKADLPARKGRYLCSEIKSIKTGRAHAEQFEKSITAALKYVFDTDLTAWCTQKATDRSISIYDVVARVASEHDFWKTIVQQFRSRYIVFELKNYNGRIKKGQIYSTEKYLFVAALRSIAIIISPKGADKNALAAARGALRESGKLMINLNVGDLCTMLALKDDGDDHNAVLVDRVDDMLMKLER
jgi:Restriction endonuclease